MNVKRVGFYFELPVPDRITTLRSIRREKPSPEEVNVLKYLESGAMYAAVPGVEVDVLTDPTRLIGPMHIRTDGVWAWPETLAYYVRTYHITVPGEFVEHMRANGWSCPPLPETDRLNLEGHVTMG